jgi:hypothetical protein
MPTNFQQSKDVLHPLAFEFINKCKNLNAQLDASEINAIDFLTRQLLQNNLWDKFKAIYPFVGKSSQTHSLNLKNLQRHTIVWYNQNDLKHDKFGVTNSNIGYGNTMVAPSWFSDNDIHISVYNSTYWQNTNDTAPIIGSSPASDPTKGWMHTIYLRSLAPILNSQINTLWDRAPIFTYSCGYSSNSSVRFAGTDGSEFQHVETYGFIVGVNGIKCYVNGNLYGRQGVINDVSTQPINQVSTRTVNGNTAQIPNISQFPFLLFTNGRFTSTNGQARANIRFASIGYELTDQENKVLYNIIQEFQKILGRSVEPIILKTFQQNLIDQYLTLNIKINKIFIQPTKPYREYLNIEMPPKQQKKINALSASVDISRIEVFGPVRVFCADTSKTTVSIQSLVEL